MNNHSDKKMVTVLLPAYNEEHSISAVIAQIKELNPDFEILVVNDGSQDNTKEQALNAGARVISHPYNIGNGAAIKTGLRNASGEWTVMMDSDGQHRPEEIALLLEHIDEYDMVVGARSKSSDTSIHRDIANKIYNWLASYLTHFRVQDLTSGFRVVRTETARKFIYLFPNTFSYPSTITLAYLKSGRSVLYIPIQTKARVGKSKIRLIKDGIRFFLIITKIATIYAPLRIFVPLSLVLFLTGLGYYLYTFIVYHRFTNMSMLLFTASLLIFLMGLISEQITTIRYDDQETEMNTVE